MISIVQISPELAQHVLYEKINDATVDVRRLIETQQQYDKALQIFHQILDNAARLTNCEQRDYVIFYLIQNEQSVFQPLTKLPRQQQDQWIDWLRKAQQFVLNFGINSSLAIAKNLEQIAKGYQILRLTERG